MRLFNEKIIISHHACNMFFLFLTIIIFLAFPFHTRATDFFNYNTRKDRLKNSKKKHSPSITGSPDNPFNPNNLRMAFRHVQEEEPSTILAIRQALHESD